MSWLFERTVECAAWIALIFFWGAAILMTKWLIEWTQTLKTAPDFDLLLASLQAAGVAVAFAVALGILACIDHFVFDQEE